MVKKFDVLLQIALVYSIVGRMKKYLLGDSLNEKIKGQV